jgi:G patch domain/KOW motif-containing protein
MSENDSGREIKKNKPFLQLKKKKLKKKKQQDAAVQEHFDDAEAAGETASSVEDVNKQREPLVIPLPAEDAEAWKRKRIKQESVRRETVEEDEEDAAAARALQEEAAATTTTTTTSGGGPAALVKSGTERVIPASVNREQEENERYKAGLDQLPDAPSVEDSQYQSVPIAEFGAALLRGMGWKGDENGKQGDDDAVVQPRPHRLGLGAIPAAPDPGTVPKSRRPDDMRRQKALQQQQEEYERQRQEQKARDKQRTLQTGSIVFVASQDGENARRARILKLVGVPGLNMVQIQYEGEAEPSVIKRGNIEGLVSRELLEGHPFREAKRTEEREQRRTEIDEKGADRRERKPTRDENGDRKRRRSRDREEEEDRERQRRSRRDEQDREDDRRQSKKKKTKSRDRDDRPKHHWIVPNIRVRVVTEKLGRRYFRQKAVIVDVTPAGATLHMDGGGSVLDRVPERYLETALPKAGGKVVVLSGPNRTAKGRLLERDSSKQQGVVQVFEDMSVLTLSLDDIAEWCGPLDDDLG